MAGLALASWQGAWVRRQLEQQHDPMLQSALGERSDMNVCHQWATIGLQPSVAQHDWPLAGRHFAIATRQQLHGGSPNGQLIQLDAFAGWSGKAQQLLGRRVVNVNPMVFIYQQHRRRNELQHGEVAFTDDVELAAALRHLFVGGLQLFVQRLQFFVGGFQLFIGRLQLLVGRLQFFVGGLQLLVGGFQFFVG